MLDLCLRVAKASKRQNFMWRHIEPLICKLFIQAEPLSIAIASPHFHWNSPMSSDWVSPWGEVVSTIQYTDEVGQSVVDTLLQIASVGSLRPRIPDGLWPWMNTQRSLPSICWGRSVGGTSGVVQKIRALKDIGVLKSYLLLIWSEWVHILPGLEEMCTSIQEDFSGEGEEMAHYRMDLLQHLDHILDQLNLGLEHFQQHKPSLNEEKIQQMKDQYGELRGILLEVNRKANPPICESFSPIVLFGLISPVTRNKTPVVYVCNPSPKLIVISGTALASPPTFCVLLATNLYIPGLPMIISQLLLLNPSLYHTATMSGVIVLTLCLY